ncbi:MAG: NAD(P)/FAD-dependent oxidoreductase [Clostridia bacterium]|nr:NAD(P)/FAD-dependent oxidoreductase [Clostridia bacterium]MBN2883535.1 NAD(P)/FAD-dependent oxidoreductase [Clostridia bacterium]
MTKKLVIIGAGIAGLSTGIYAQKSGFSSEIYEMHTLPGGVCTSWKRGDYLFDHCLHWVLGCNKGTSLYPVFRDLGISDGIEFHYSKVFRHIICGSKSIKVYTNIDSFEAELSEHYPGEIKGIGKYMKMVRRYTSFNPPIDGDFGDFSFLDYLKMIPFIPSFLNLKNITIENYLNKLFKSSDIKEMLFRLFPVKNMPALMAVLPLSYMHIKEGGYPLGGSLRFSQVIENRYKDMGGKIHYGSKVKRIIVRNKKAAGIELEDGRLIEADIVISACDGHSTIFDMLEGKFVSKEIASLYMKPKLWPPLISISLGINRDFSGLAEITDIKLDKSIDICGKKLEWAGFFNYCHDPSFAPSGKSVIQTQIETDYDYWTALYKNDEKEYYDEKSAVLEKVMDILEETFPGIRSCVEESDVATPVTWERYTGNWRASYQGWMPSIESFGIKLPKVLPGLKNFYMTGQWVFPGGGVPICMAQGRNLIKLIVKEHTPNQCE